MGNKECDALGDVETCADDVAGGCPVFGNPTACPNADQVCSAGACSCGTTLCTVVGPFCVDGTHEATCSTDAADGCLDEGTPTACTSPEVCAGAAGSAACACPAVSATVGAGLGCATAGVVACDPVTFGVDTCTAVVVGTATCKVWEGAATGSPGDCVAASLTCQTQGGTAACQCPAHVAGQPFFVDPVNGSAPGAGVYPTGLQTPSQCAFGTLTAALAVAPSGGTVEATGTTPATFTHKANGNSETFPITVPAGVLLTTSDATPNPADFLISFNSATAASAVILGGAGAGLQGFTIQNNGGSATADALACTAGAVTINAVDLVAAAAGSATHLSAGLNVSGTCAPTASDLNVTGFTGDGVSIDTTSGTSAFTSSTFSTNGTGLLASSGLTTLTGVTITKSVANGVEIAAGVAGNPTVTITDGEITANGVAAGGAANGINLVSGALTVDGTAVTGNGLNGLLVAGGSASLGLDANNLGAAFDGNGVSAAGAGLSVTGGTAVTATSIDASGNKGDGVSVTGGTTITLNSSTFGNNAAGVSYAGNTVDGLYVLAPAGTTVNVHGALMATNGARGVELSTGNTPNAATVNIDGTLLANGTLITGNGATTNDADVRASAGILNVTGSAAAPVNIEAAVKGFGVNIAGATTTLTSVSITGNPLSGINVTNPAAVPVNVTSCTVTGNTGNGVNVVQSPKTTGGSISLFLTTTTISGNGGDGVDLVGTGSIQTFLNGCTITGNTSTGVVVTQGTAAGVTTVADFEGNTIESNFPLAAAGSAGGVSFPGPSTTVGAFYNNSVAGNGGDQILLAGTGAWSLNGVAGGSSCNSANQIFCYKAATSVGLRVTSATATVDASYNSWTDAPPIVGDDYNGATPANITVTPDCAKVTAACP